MTKLVYPSLPYSDAYLAFDLGGNDAPFISSQEAYSEDQMREYAEPLLRRIQELEADLALA
jgi:hypothetical protein